MNANDISREQALKLEAQGDHAGAVAIYRRLLAADPSNPELLNDRAAALIDLGEYAAAEADLAKAISAAPQVAVAHINLAIVCFMLGRMTRASESAARAFALAPDRRDYREVWQALKSLPFFGVGAGIQGSHAPERQVFMSAAVDLLKDCAPRLAILEIGSYMGSSLLTWANAIKRLHGGTATVVCVDPWGIGDTAPQYEKAMADALVTNQAYEIFLHHASLVPENVTVEPIRDLSENALPRLREGTFDIVYIDGCHYFREALFDMQEGRRLVKDGGILCGDDLELQAGACDLEHARQHAREDYIRDPGSGRYFHPGVTLAVHETFGEVSSFSGFWAMRKIGKAFSRVAFANARGVAPPHWPATALDRIKSYFSASSELGQLLD
jgi:tetratricopeptide (TPR) repeat protein